MHETLNRYVCSFVSVCHFNFANGSSMVWNLKGGDPPIGEATLTFKSIYQDIGFKQPIPVALLVECDLRAESMQEAIGAAESLIAFVVPVIGFSANAAFEDPELLTAYDFSEQLEQHDLIAVNIRPDHSAATTGSRRVSGEASVALFDPIFKHPSGTRLHRALIHYNEALKHWADGKELRAVQSLYVACEALGEVAKKEQLEAGETIDGLKNKWADAVTSRKCPSCSHSWIVDGAVDPAAIRKVIFNDDNGLLKKVREISNGLEHSYKDFPWLHSQAKEVRDELVKVVRRAILALLRVSEPHLTALTTAPYAKPKRVEEIKKTARFTLTGKHDELAGAGQTHPQVIWASQLKDTSLNEDGSVSMEWEETHKLLVGEGVTWRQVAFDTGSRSGDLRIGPAHVIKADGTKIPIPLKEKEAPTASQEKLVDDL